ncbi:unnamed protein product [Parajaminaea phylloscopi]
MSSTDPSVAPPLGQGVGYGIVVGAGFAFAIGMFFITSLLKRYTGEDNRHFETYATAGRSVGTGLTAVAVISSWAWSTALLSSSVVTYSYGIAGAYWFAAGCLVQISGFAVLAIRSKLIVPHAHTSLEAVKVRYGAFTHAVFIFLCLVNNLIAVVNMFLGSSATISALTGMHTVAAIFLLPIGVCLYTISGGLRATFITDYLHTVALLIISVYLVLKTLRNDNIQSPKHLMELVLAATTNKPIEGNAGGSYFTMASKPALYFGILHTLGNFALVIMDSSYWQKAFSANVSAAVPGYLLGGVLYFGIPWALGTVMGLAAVGLENNPVWPAFGRALTAQETADGLPLGYAALAVAGKGGAVATVVIIFMAVTSTCSSQIIAVSSIVSSDIYHTYINPAAKDKSVIAVSRYACVGFALVGCAVSVAFYYAGLSLTWTLYFLGVIVCPGMFVLPLTIFWKKQTRLAAIVSPLVGMACGLATWLGTAYKYAPDGKLNVTTTGALLPCLWGTIASAFVPPILTVIISYAKPEPDWDWSEFNKIKLVHHDDDSASTLFEDRKGAGQEDGKLTEQQQKQQSVTITALEREDNAATHFTEAEVRYMKRASTFAGVAGIVLFLVVWVLVPFATWGKDYVFTWRVFTGWVIVAVIWLFVSLLVVTFMPPIEGWRTWQSVINGLRGIKAPVPTHEQQREKGETVSSDHPAVHSSSAKPSAPSSSGSSSPTSPA